MIESSDRTPDVRLARFLVPVSLLREVDALVSSGKGGYESRQEFFIEALQNHLLEVKHGPSEAGQFHLSADLGHADNGTTLGGTAAQAIRERRAGASATAAPQQHLAIEAERIEPPALPAVLTESAIEAVTEIAQTAIKAPPRGKVVTDGIARFKKEPLLGLHNRDYPSIWAARLLGEMTKTELVPAPGFHQEATNRGWRYAHALLGLERESKTKLTALFPSNVNKPQSAEEGFRAFALGTFSRKPSADGKIEASGPLFSWGIAQLVKPNGTAHIGLTATGWELLSALDGLTLAWPHEQSFALRFFDHLRKHAPWDWAGFEQVMLAVAGSPTRAELAAHFGRWQPEWSDAMANTTSSGFVARAREWGLIEPKLVDGRYALTEFGQSLHTQRSAA